MTYDPHARSGLDQGDAQGGASRDVDAHRLEDLLGTVSHDLKSPLSAIMMTAATLGRIEADERVRPQLRRKAETIQRCAERMARVIDELLDLANLQCGRFTIETARHDPAVLVEESLAKLRDAAQERGVGLRVSASTPLPAVECDRERIIQVLTGLVENAVSATDEAGAVEVGATRRGDGEVVFFVQDTASPSSGARDRGQRKRQALVLTIARGIVLAHRGRIWAESAGEAHRISFSLAASAEPAAGAVV